MTPTVSNAFDCESNATTHWPDGEKMIHYYDNRNNIVHGVRLQYGGQAWTNVYNATIKVKKILNGKQKIQDRDQTWREFCNTKTTLIILIISYVEKNI